MKLTLDTSLKTIEIDEQVTINDLLKWLKDHDIDLNDYSFIPSPPSVTYYPYPTVTSDPGLIPNVVFNQE